MAFVTVPRLAAAAMAVLVAMTAACSGSHPVPAPKPTVVPTTATTSAPADLSNVLTQPPGFIAMPDDNTSGPLQTPDEVRKYFTDRPSDPAEILSHGFVGGFVRNWQVAQNPLQGATGAVAPILIKIVLQFDTAAHALTVEQYFRHAKQLWPTSAFPVPSRLAAGYGQAQVQGSGSTATYVDAVVWTDRTRLFQVAVGYSARPASPAQVISLAVAQAKATP